MNTLHAPARAWRARGLALALFAAAVPGTLAAGELEVPRVLTLSRAVELAAAANPRLAATGIDLRIAQARRADAGRRPTPSLEASAENWGRTLGSGRMETTIAVGQLLELGGDRRARTGMASAEVAGASADRRIELRQLSLSVAEEFIGAWVLQERLRQLRESRRIAAEAVVAAGERHAAGAAPAVERIRAEGSLALAEAELVRTAAALSAARRALALRWNQSEAQIDSLELPRPHLSPPPAFDSVRSALTGHPEHERAASTADLAAARVRAVRAGRVPDLDARFGVRELREAGGAGWVAGVSLPIPVWGTGGGAQTAAEGERARAALSASATERRLESELRSALERLTASIAAFREIEERGVPAADQGLATLRSTYGAGRLGYLDLVEGQRAALAARLAAVEGAADVWRARVELEWLVGPGPTAIPREVER